MEPRAPSPFLRKNAGKRSVQRRPSVERIVSESLEYLRNITCYDILPVNSKLIFLDSSLLVKKALYALLQNGIRSAPLWDHSRKCLEGLLTATDFLNVILHFYTSNSTYEQLLEEMSQLTIRSMRERKLIPVPEKILYVSPSASVYEAATMLVDYKVHRILMIDKDVDESDMIVSVMTPFRILNFMAVNVSSVLPATLGSCIP